MVGPTSAIGWVGWKEPTVSDGVARPSLFKPPRILGMALLCVSSSILGWCVQMDGVLDSVFVGCVKAEHPHGALDAGFACFFFCK